MNSRQITHFADDATLARLAEIERINADLLAERDRLKAVNAELLAALEHLLDEVSAGSKSLDFNNGKKAARAAIAKARES